MWIVYVLAGIAVLGAFASYMCFRICFYSPDNEKYRDRPFPSSMDAYLPKLDQWYKETKALPCEEVWITSFDGLKLHGRFFECPTANGTIELMVHGYRGNGDRDLCGGVMRAFKLNHSVLMVDQRGCGISEGHVITFGIREKRDCLKWAEFLDAKFNGERKIILTGISMGAATVLSTTALNLPESVVGVIADCGYSSPKKIIKHVLTKTRFPNITTFLLIRIGAILFGGFDICKYSQEEDLKNCRIPVFFVHGEDDKFVPCDMSRENYNSVPVKKKLVTVPNAKHGMSYLILEDEYITHLKKFFYSE